VSKSRPKNLSVASMKMPLTAIASILHRISGLILFLLIPLLLYWFEQSMASAASFNALAAHFHTPVVRFFAWVVMSAGVYHLIAGIKHLLMDIGYFEENVSSKVMSALVLMLGVLAAVILGVALWG
jgi:succinate dehydrogenase / fumarate reductase cytochrome b subunit